MTCSECGGTGLNGHGVGCNTGQGVFQIVINGVIVDHAYVELGAYRQLVNIRENSGTLTGVRVYRDGKRLTREQLGDMAIRQLNSIA